MSGDFGALRDALEALEALNRLEAKGEAPASRDRLRKALDRFLEDFPLGPYDQPLARRLSGAWWCGEFPDTAALSDLEDAFEKKVRKFIDAMEAAGARVHVSSTLRPSERMYLMHYCWRIAKEGMAAKDVPTKAGVDIKWVHPEDAQSVAAARAMVAGYNIVRRPSLTSRHSEGKAIDMTISWAGDLVITDAAGKSVKITSTPRNGENADLARVGAGYGVIKAIFAGDPPHWSNDGH
jgi:D-alanyl-D-alanine dipeptidase